METFCNLPNTHYKLNIFLNNVNDNIVKKYKEAARKSNINFTTYNLHDAGIDLYTPYSQSIKPQTHSNKINLGIKCSMQFIDKELIMPCGYYMYMRSSTGSKTPLRLSNSVGIMDAGYRGEVMACFDNITKHQIYEVEEGDRLVQICPPNITYPLLLNVVSDENELDSNGLFKNQRGIKGFGSTGK